MIKIFSKSQTVKDAFVSVTGLGITATIGMIFTIVSARYLGPADFGLYSTLNAVVTILASLGDFGMTSALISFIPKNPKLASSYVNLIFWSQLLVAILLTLTLWLLSSTSTKFILGSTQDQQILVAVLTGIYVIQGFVLGSLNAFRHFLLNAIVQITDSFLKLLICFIFLTRQELSIGFLLTANLVSSSISVLVGMVYQVKHLDFAPNLSLLSGVIRYSHWVAISRFFTVGISRIDVLLLTTLVGSYYAGIYSASSRFSLLFTLLAVSVGNVANPRMSTLKSPKLLVPYLVKLSFLMSGLSLLMLLSIFIAKPLILFVFGIKYLETVPVFVTTTLAMIPYLFSIITVGPILYTYEHSGYYAFICFVQISIIILFDLLLIPKYLALAPSISLGIANLVVLGLSFSRLSGLLKQADEKI